MHFDISEAEAFWKHCGNSLIIIAFPHVDVFWRLCSRQLFENIVTKVKIAHNEQHLLLPQCFPLLVIGYPFNYRDFLFVDKICSKSSAAELPYEGKGYSFIKFIYGNYPCFCLYVFKVVCFSFTVYEKWLTVIKLNHTE